MTSHWGRVGGKGISRLTKRSGSVMTAISNRHSSSQLTSMPRYGNMPTGASPARRFGERVSAGPKADLNSSHRDDHSTSRCGGSGHGSFVGQSGTSGMASTSDIFWTAKSLGDWDYCSVPEALLDIREYFGVFCVFDSPRRLRAEFCGDFEGMSVLNTPSLSIFWNQELSGQFPLHL